MQVGQQHTTGSGPNKKLAKRAAAEALLQLLGYSRPSLQPSKPAIKTGPEIERQDKGKKVGKGVKFIETRSRRFCLFMLSVFFPKCPVSSFPVRSQLRVEYRLVHSGIEVCLLSFSHNFSLKPAPFGNFFKSWHSSQFCP